MNNIEDQFINATLPTINFIYENLPDNALIICNKYDAFITYKDLSNLKLNQKIKLKKK